MKFVKNADYVLIVVAYYSQVDISKLPVGISCKYNFTCWMYQNLTKSQVGISNIHVGITC